ncbi:hypothetical protein A3E89_02730 [Candidatus Campbellbacteria bacterium RIFCSPHIGHO2_12_FULL_35_10]|uniref:Uncharacterized protein n=1 Tax=Candidatus Campbellbacteria bacterium RIFCSPHIGHO2_12_FULL_35_10 TaxID=1797578 RepID=A0A1F5EKV7_9BACT|nr:MAG: hypothetical protein A3E89_02730 [Candidatus Campbellbacteria bacterium RIFCSPHIGHO2_12_FULL_35_10]
MYGSYFVAGLSGFLAFFFGFLIIAITATGKNSSSYVRRDIEGTTSCFLNMGFFIMIAGIIIVIGSIVCFCINYF